MNKADRLRKKYAYIKNNYPHLSSKDLMYMRNWGWKRIYQELALTKPKNFKRVTKKDEYKPSYVKRKQTDYEYLQVLKKARVKDDTTEELKPQFDPQLRELLIKSDTRADNRSITKLKYKKNYKHDNWVKWSGDKFPVAILGYIHRKNIKMGLDINNSYGFTYTYYRLIYGFNDRYTRKLITPDPLSKEGVIYTRAGVIKRG